MSGRPIYLTLAACLLLISVWAQRADSVHHLREVSVTAPRAAREIMPGQHLEGKALQRLGVQSVADAIRFFSGVQVKDYGGIGGLKTVDVRGMGTNHTGVFYDGIQLGNAQNGQVDLGRFSLDNMQEIGLYNGQKSQIFQPAKDFSAASAIYLTALKPHFEGNEITHLRGTIKTGSFGLFNPSLLWQQKLSDRISASFSSEWTHAHGRYKFRYRKKNGYDTTATRKNSDIDALRIEGGLNGVMQGGEWSTKLYYYNAERGLPGFVVNGVFGHVDRQWDRSFFWQSSFRKDLSKRYSLLLNGKYAYDYTRYLAPDTALLYLDNRYHQKEIYFSMAHQYALKSWWNLAFSSDFQWNKLDANLVNFSYPQRYTTLAAIATSVHFQRFSAQVSWLASIISESVKKNTAAPYKQEGTPSVYLSWALPRLRLNAFYKRIFRMPTFNDLYYTDIGNSNLRPEFTTQYNAGAAYKFGSIDLQADVYYNEVKDKIVAMPTSSQFRWTMMNLGFVKIKGADLKASGTWLFRKSLQLNARVTYTYQRAQDFTDPADSFHGDQILYIPWHSGSAVINAVLEQWDLQYSLIYTGQRYNGKANIPENYVMPWYTSDLSLARQWKWLRLSAQVNNIFNQYYDVVLNYPMPGRNYKFVLAVNM